MGKVYTTGPLLNQDFDEQTSIDEKILEDMPNKKIIPHEKVSDGYEYIPTPEGKILNETQVDELAQVLYSRFIYRPGMPVLKDDTFAGDIKAGLIKGIRQVVDSMLIKGYKIIPPNSKA